MQVGPGKAFKIRDRDFLLKLYIRCYKIFFTADRHHLESHNWPEIQIKSWQSCCSVKSKLTISLTPANLLYGNLAKCIEIHAQLGAANDVSTLSQTQFATATKRSKLSKITLSSRVTALCFGRKERLVDGNSDLNTLGLVYTLF
ncbi:hypothetical protein ACU8KH_03069 [Lachancea thermotolerans]